MGEQHDDSMSGDQGNPFIGWCVLELMGHRRLAGMVSEQEIAGAAFIRLDVPGDGGTVATQFYSPSSVYCLTPTTEEVARAVAKRERPEPVQRWELAAPGRAEAAPAAAQWCGKCEEYHAGPCEEGDEEDEEDES